MASSDSWFVEAVPDFKVKFLEIDFKKVNRKASEDEVSQEWK